MILADDWFLEQQGMPTHKAVIQTAGKTIMRRVGVGRWWIFTRSRMTRRMAGLILCVPVRLRQLHRHLLGLSGELGVETLEYAIIQRQNVLLDRVLDEQILEFT